MQDDQRIQVPAPVQTSTDATKEMRSPAPKQISNDSPKVLRVSTLNSDTLTIE